METTDQNIIVEFKTDNDELLESINEYLHPEGGAAKLLQWESRGIHEWMLSNYGFAPTIHATDEAVAKRLIQCALLYHMEIKPDEYELQVKIDKPAITNH